MLGVLKTSWRKNWPEIHCALRGGLPAFLLRSHGRLRPGAVPAFCYHAPDAATLEADLRHLVANGYHTLSADRMLDHLSGRAPAGDRAVVLTFDDGARALYTTVYPLLRQYGFTGVAFICPYFHDHAAVGDGEARACTWDEIGEMHASGVIDFQSHTYQHRRIPQWPEPAPLCGVTDGLAIASGAPSLSLGEDLELARNVIGERLGKVVRHLGFPCYDGTATAIRLARRAGYEGFWWGTLPRVPDNLPGPESAEHIVRVSGEFVRRLPGSGRVSLASILRRRYGANLRRWRGLPGDPRPSVHS